LEILESLLGCFLIAPGLAVENDYRYVGVYKVLDVLQKIKAEDDSTLVMQGRDMWNCGSCALNVDGTNTVACLKPVHAATSEAIRDLVVDLTIFYMQYK
jgi:succinate dehydrogenase/fumarate reductase-like Fe-S protein